MHVRNSNNLQEIHLNWTTLFVEIILFCVQVGSTLHTYVPVCVRDASKTTSWRMGFLSERKNNGYNIINVQCSWGSQQINVHIDFKLKSLVSVL